MTTTHRETAPIFAVGDTIGAYRVAEQLGLRHVAASSVPWRLQHYRAVCIHCGTEHVLTQNALHLHGRRSKGDACGACRYQTKPLPIGTQAGYAVVIDRERDASGHWRYQVEYGCCHRIKWVSRQWISEHVSRKVATCIKCIHPAGKRTPEPYNRSWEGYDEARAANALLCNWGPSRIPTDAR